jgi:hypothetical protein
MNCEKCQELLSDFLDGALSSRDHTELGAHLEECLHCFTIRDEINSIVDFCREHRGEYVSPPNERALWLRIHNTIESEGRVAAATASPSPAPGRSESWWSGLMGRTWELSFSQMTAAVAMIAVVVALITAFSVQRLQNNTAGSTPTIANAGTFNGTSPSNVAGPVAQSFSDVDDRMRQQQLVIEYWNQRVEQRKAHWNQQMRDAFDRNMSVIDQAVNYSRDELRRNPHDEVSEEMLDAALNDKMELLREFSDL